MPDADGTSGPAPGRGLEGWSEALYRNLIERVPAVVYIDSNDQRPDSLYISPQVEEVFGHPPEAYLADPELWRKQTHADDVELIRETWRRAREDEATFDCEYRLIRPDGAVVWVHDSAAPMRGSDGRIEFWQGVLYDVTLAKRAEEDLRRAERKYRTLLENLPAVVYMVAPDDDRRTLWVSPHVERTLGYSREEWLEQPDIWMELLHPDDREPTLAAHDLHNETGEPWSREYRLIASDGRAVWFRDVATLVRDEDGNPASWQGLQLDITELKMVEGELRAARDELEMRVMERTAALEEANALMSLEIGERRRAEAELVEAERRYRALAEQIPAVTYTWEIGGALAEVYTSPRIEQLLGYTADEWDRSEDFWISRIHPDDRRSVLAATLRSEATGEPFSMEYRYLHREGHIVWVQDQATILARTSDGRPWLFQGVMLDITARKEAEAEASRSEHRYQDLAEQVPGIIYLLEMRSDGPGFTITYVSPQIRTMLGLEPEAWRTDEDWLASIDPEDRERVIATAAETEISGGPWVAEYRMLHADGRVVWIRDRGRVLERDPSGRPRIMQGLAEDITNEKLASESVRASQQLYRTLVEELPAITFIEAPAPDAPRETRLTYVSPQVEAVLGYTPEELTSDPTAFERTLHPDDLERVMEANVRSEETGEPFDQVYRRATKDGRVVWLHTRAVLVRDEDGDPSYWHGMSLDISERMRAEEQLREMQGRYEDLAGRAFRSLGLEADR